MQDVFIFHNDLLEPIFVVPGGLGAGFFCGLAKFLDEMTGKLFGFLVLPVRDAASACFSQDAIDGIQQISQDQSFFLGLPMRQPPPCCLYHLAAQALA